MLCPKCGNAVNSDSEFCKYCGAKIGEKSETSETKYCAVCGFKLEKDDTFCPNCGTSAEEKSEKPILDYFQKEENNEKDEKLLAFVGYAKYSYYQKRFKDLEKNPVSWNWCSFLFGPFWFFYRKNFIPAIIYLLCVLSFAIMNHYLNIEAIEKVTSSISLATWVASGLFGNYLYKQKYIQTLNESAKYSESEQIKYLNNHGGTCTGYIFLLIGIYVSYVIITNIIWHKSNVEDFPFVEATKILSELFRGR